MKITKLIKTSEIGSSKQKEQFAIDILTGLSSSHKNISAKYFYDDIGSELFQQITKHKDYYPTRMEFNILSDLRDKLPQIINEKEIDIIELGVGDGHKSQIILEGFLEQDCIVNFYPIDISEKAMTLLEKNIKPHANLNIHGVVAEYFEGLRFVTNQSKNKQLVLFLGSNIGNFDRIQNHFFLRSLWKNLNAMDFAIIGFDLKKDIKVLTSAYNDASGYTEKFNLNLLSRINKELGGNFDLEKFQHFGVYNPKLGAMESYLLAREEHNVYISEIQRSFHFFAFEPIHIEYSFKFSQSDINLSAKETGFEIIDNFTDSQKYFINSLWKVVKG